MDTATLCKANKLEQNIKNLDAGIERINNTFNSTQATKSLIINGVELFGGTSSLLYNCGFTDVKEVHSFLVRSILEVLENKRKLLQEEFDVL